MCYFGISAYSGNTRITYRPENPFWVWNYEKFNSPLHLTKKIKDGIFKETWAAEKYAYWIDFANCVITQKCENSSIDFKPPVYFDIYRGHLDFSITGGTTFRQY
jgi:hypothetical protein